MPANLTFSERVQGSGQDVLANFQSIYWHYTSTKPYARVNNQDHPLFATLSVRTRYCCLRRIYVRSPWPSFCAGRAAVAIALVGVHVGYDRYRSGIPSAQEPLLRLMSYRQRYDCSRALKVRSRRYPHRPATRVVTANQTLAFRATPARFSSSCRL